VDRAALGADTLWSAIAMDEMSDRGPAGSVRRDLRLEDLSDLTTALHAADRPSNIYRAVEELSGEVIGHRLFTVMRLCAGGSEIERVHTSLAAIYPLGGRKKKADTAWAGQVLREMQVFRASTPDDIRAAFDDHQTILKLGIGSILNIPIVFQRRCLGTMNLCHRTGWYRQEDESAERLLATFLIPALLEIECQ
jgi:GAF domain-containing protein